VSCGITISALRVSLRQGPSTVTVEPAPNGHLPAKESRSLGPRSLYNKVRRGLIHGWVDVVVISFGKSSGVCAQRFDQVVVLTFRLLLIERRIINCDVISTDSITSSRLRGLVTSFRQCTRHHEDR
jgi:hypothetical protein